MIIMKFGGTSVGSAESIRRVRDIVLDRVSQQPIVVVSAVGGITNLLVELAKASRDEADKLKHDIYDKHETIIDELWSDSNNQELKQYVKSTLELGYRDATELSGAQRTDKISALGETLSSRIVSSFIAERHPAEQALMTQYLVTDDAFGSAEVIEEATRHRLDVLWHDMRERNAIPVATGFIAATEDGRTTTLGRGGSDYTAALLGYYLDADEIQIWTDVDGVFSSDPRKIKSARLIEEMTYQEASELAAFGAKVLHPKTMRPAVHGEVPIRIANTFHPDAPTTRIVSQTNRSAEVIAVAAKQSVVMVNIYAVEMLLERGFLARISSVFARHNISIDIISASETSVSVTLDNHEQLDAAISELETFSAVTMNDTVGLVSVIGQGVSSQPKILARIAQTLTDIQVTLEMVSVGAQGINISLVVASHDVPRVNQRLHELCERR